MTIQSNLKLHYLLVEGYLVPVSAPEPQSVEVIPEGSDSRVALVTAVLPDSSGIIAAGYHIELTA